MGKGGEEKRGEEQGRCQRGIDTSEQLHRLNNSSEARESLWSSNKSLLISVTYLQL